MLFGASKLLTAGQLAAGAESAIEPARPSFSDPAIASSAVSGNVFHTNTPSGPARPDKSEKKEARAAARRECKQAKAERKRERDQAKKAAQKEKHESKEAAREGREEARRAARDAKDTNRRESMNLVPSGFDPPEDDETDAEAQARVDEEERRRRADAKVLGLADSTIPNVDSGGAASTSGPVRAAEEARAAEQARAARAAEEASAAEEARAAEEVRAARAAEEVRAAETSWAAEQIRATEEARAVEEARAAEQVRATEAAWAAEQTRAAEEARAVEQAKAAEEARAASAAAPIAGMGESAFRRSDADDQERTETTHVAPVESAADDQEYGSDEYGEPEATDSGDYNETAGRSRKSRGSGLRPVASLAAGVVGILGLVASVVLAVGAFTVAVGAGDGNAIYDPISVVCNALVGPLKDAFSFSGPNAASRQEFLGWGAGSILYLALSFAGQAAQRALSSD